MASSSVQTILGNTKSLSHSFGDATVNLPQDTPSKPNYSIGEKIITGVGGALLKAPIYTATGIKYATGANKPTSGQKAGDKSLEEAQSALVKALKDKNVPAERKTKVQAVLDALTTENVQAATANTKTVEDATNKRRFLASAYETGLTPFLLGNPAGDLSKVAKTGVLTAQSAGYGALSGLEAEKFTKGELAKDIAVGASIPLAAHALGATVKAARGVTNPKELSVAPELTSGNQGIDIPANNKVANLDIKPTPETFQNFAVPTKSTPYTPAVEKTLNETKLASPKTSNLKGIGQEVKNWFTPGGGAEGKLIANDLRATTGNLALTKNSESIAAKEDVKFFQGMKPGEHLNFIQKIESGVKQATPELQAQADKIRVAQEADYALGKSIKPELVHVDNYFPRAGFWDNSNKEVDAFLQKFQQPSLGGKATALQERSFPTIYDGIKFGLTPKESNPAIIALNSRTQLLRAKAAQDFIEEQVATGHDPALVKEYVDRVMGKGIEGSAIYRSLKDATYAVNNVQLGFSGFHVAGTGINSVVGRVADSLQEVVNKNFGKAVKDLVTAPVAPFQQVFGSGNQIIKDFKAGNITQDIRNIAEGGGRVGSQVEYRTTGLAKSLEQIKSGEASQIAKGIAAAPLRAFSEAAKPVMEYWVPRIKAGATKELIDRKLAALGPNASESAIRAAKAEAVDSIDNRFGQLVKDNLMWKKTLKDYSGLAMRSPGWNIGTVREIGGGLTDLATRTARGGGLSERSAYAASLGATTMMLGTALSYMFTGQPPQDLKDYFFPKTGKVDKNGNDERVSLPTYAKDIFAFSHNPGQTLANKTNPLISEGLQLRANKDYYGNLIRNPQDSLLTQAKQVKDYLVNSNLPFTITGGNKRVDKGAGTKTQSFFGLNPAPGYITKSSFQQSVETALNKALGSKPLTPEEAAKVTTKSDAKQKAKFGDNSQIDDLVRSGQLTKKQGEDLKQSSTQTSLSNQFSYLLKVDKQAAAELISKAKPEDLKKLDTNSLVKELNKFKTNKNATQTNKDAASKLLQVLNSRK